MHLTPDENAALDPLIEAAEQELDNHFSWETSPVFGGTALAVLPDGYHLTVTVDPKLGTYVMNPQMTCTYSLAQYKEIRDNG